MQSMDRGRPCCSKFLQYHFAVALRCLSLSHNLSVTGYSWQPNHNALMWYTITCIMTMLGCAAHHTCQSVPA